MPMGSLPAGGELLRQGHFANRGRGLQAAPTPRSDRLRWWSPPAKLGRCLNPPGRANPRVLRCRPGPGIDLYGDLPRSNWKRPRARQGAPRAGAGPAAAHPLGDSPTRLSRTGRRRPHRLNRGRRLRRPGSHGRSDGRGTSGRKLLRRPRHRARGYRAKREPLRIDSEGRAGNSRLARCRPLNRQ